jgi:hypothetical protein
MRVMPALLFAASLGLACDQKPATVAADATPPKAADKSLPALPAFAPSEAQAAPAAPASGQVSGAVLETMDSGGYTYMRLQTPQGETWAAVPKTVVKKGATVTLAGAMPMDGFESKTLNRRFDRILFGSLAEAPAATDDDAGPAVMPAGHPPVGAAAMPAEVAVGKVDRAGGSDGRTVSEVHAQRKDLHDKAVTVRGQVVKFLPGIMGRNWLHLQDGSGSRAAKDDDLTVTTLETAAVGEVVTVKGVVRADRDFGSGYAYAVIVEEARLVR